MQINVHAKLLPYNIVAVNETFDVCQKNKQKIRSSFMKQWLTSFLNLVEPPFKCPFHPGTYKLRNIPAVNLNLFPIVKQLKKSKGFLFKIAYRFYIIVNDTIVDIVKSDELHKVIIEF